MSVNVSIEDASSRLVIHICFYIVWSFYHFFGFFLVFFFCFWLLWVLKIFLVLFFHFFLYCIFNKNIILIFRIQGSISRVYVLCDDGFPTDLLIVSHTEEGYEYCYLLSRAFAIAENQLAIYQYLFNMFLDLNGIPRM